MLTEKDLQKIKELLDPRFDTIDKKLKEHDKKFMSIYKRFEDLDTFLHIQFDSIDQKFKEIEEKFEDHRKRIMTLQDTIIGIDKYIHGELAVVLNNHGNRITVLEHHIL